MPMQRLRHYSFIVILLHTVLAAVISASEAGGNIAGHAGCDLDRLDVRANDTITQKDKLSYAASVVAAATRPLVLQGLIDSWPARIKWKTAADFTLEHGSASGYARDHDQLELRDEDTTVAAYLLGSADNKSQLGSSAALFVNDYEDSHLLDAIRKEYETPLPLHDFGVLRVLSLERAGAGVAFHRHEASWQALLTGRKAWFLLPPSQANVPQHSPCSFVEHGSPPSALSCTVEAGETLLVPHDWWHATCSLPSEPTLGVGGVGSLTAWPAAHRAAKDGRAATFMATGDDNDAVVEHSLWEGLLPPPAAPGIFVGGEQPLFVGVAFGHLATTDALLKRGANPNAQRKDGRSAAHEAARRGNLALLRRLHEARAGLEVADREGSTPLHFACAERGSPSAVEFLLAAVDTPKKLAAQKRNDGRTALHVACRAHRDPVSILRTILGQGGAAPSPRDGLGMTPLMHCAAAGHARGVGLLLRLGGAEAAGFLDKEHRDALDHALTGRGDAGVVKRLLNAGLAVAGSERLAKAAALGELLPIQLLTEAAGVDVARAEAGAALHAAAKAGHVATARWLLQHLDASPSAAELDSGAHALHLAAFAGHLAVVEELLAADADPAAPDVDLLRPLHYAALTLGRVRLQRQKAVMEALVRYGGEMLWAVTANNSLTPLHLAAASGDVELARWLVVERRVLDPRLKSAGTTAAMAAESANHSGLAMSLRAWEAKFWAEGPMEL